MKAVLSVFAALALPMTAEANGSVLDQWRAEPTTVFDAQDVDLASLLWEVRPVVVFAQSPNDPQFRRQMELFGRDPEALAERDILLIVDTAPDPASDIRLRMRPRGFMLAIVGKDGQIKLRKPAPWDVRELTRSIDKMPLRRQEIRDAQGLNQ